MSSIDGLKTCRKGLHQYQADKRTCPDCRRESIRRWREENPERKQELDRVWREQNPERQRENNRRWQKENPERKREIEHRWREQNPERNREHKRRWSKQNPDKERAKVMRRIARKKQATPPWADHAAINAIYAEAVRLEKETGIKHHVDHIYPLQSKYLCGLHVAENLQILTATENHKKGNRTWPGQLDCQKD